MVSAHQIQLKVAEWLDGMISLPEFHAWFASETWDMHNASDDAEGRKLAAEIDLALSEYTGGYLPIDRLREELANAIHPFVEMQDVGVVERAVHFVPHKAAATFDGVSSVATAWELSFCVVGA
jgi:hypothetical protein